MKNQETVNNFPDAPDEDKYSDNKILSKVLNEYAVGILPPTWSVEFVLRCRNKLKRSRAKAQIPDANGNDVPNPDHDPYSIMGFIADVKQYIRALSNAGKADDGAALAVQQNKNVLAALKSQMAKMQQQLNAAKAVEDGPADDHKKRKPKENKELDIAKMAKEDCGHWVHYGKCPFGDRCYRKHVPGRMSSKDESVPKPRQRRNKNGKDPAQVNEVRGEFDWAEALQNINPEGSVAAVGEDPVVPTTGPQFSGDVAGDGPSDLGGAPQVHDVAADDNSSSDEDGNDQDDDVDDDDFTGPQGTFLQHLDSGANIFTIKSERHLHNVRTVPIGTVNQRGKGDILLPRYKSGRRVQRSYDVRIAAAQECKHDVCQVR